MLRYLKLNDDYFLLQLYGVGRTVRLEGPAENSLHDEVTKVRVSIQTGYRGTVLYSGKIFPPISFSIEFLLDIGWSFKRIVVKLS